MRGQGWRVSKGRAGGGHMPLLSAVKAKSFLETFLSLFLGKPFWLLSVINAHCIGVSRGSTSSRGRGVEGNGGLGGMLFGDCRGKSFLAQEVVNFLVPSLESSRDCLHS